MNVLRAFIATIVAFAAVGAGQSASAAPVDLVCPFAVTVNFNPGLTLLAQPVQITGTAAAGSSLSPLTPCSSVLTGVPYIGGTANVAGSGILGCTLIGPSGLAGNISGTLPIVWNNGDISTIAWSATFAAVVPVASATVTSGPLQGATMLVTPLPTGLTGNCITPVTSISFAGLAVFVRL